MIRKKVDFTEIEKVLPLDPIEQQKALNQILAELEKELPPIVFRNWPKWRDYLPVAPRTVANEDSLGTGPKEKIMVGRVCGYPRTAFIAWLRERSITIR